MAESFRVEGTASWFGKKRIKEIKGDYLMGEGRTKGITIPLKYLP